MNKRRYNAFLSGRWRVLIVLICLFLVVKGRVQLADCIYYADEDIEIFNRFVTEMESKRHLPYEQLVTEIVTFFLGTPYVASTLEKEPEGLVVNFREMDCSTLVDNVIALSRMLKSQDVSFEGFCHQLQYIRYRDGDITSYTDRLHYTSDWLYMNDKRNVVKDINKEIGGVPFKLDLNFMSTHTDSHEQLKASSLFIKKIKEAEREISCRHYYYIPRQKIDAYVSKIKSGDVVCFTTAIKGLDISHVGIITKIDDKLTFIHASSLAKKVIINEESLQEYVSKRKNCTGIMLARPVDEDVKVTKVFKGCMSFK